MNYEGLLKEAFSLNLVIKEKKLIAHDGLCRGNRIAISKTLKTDREKHCVLAEELGHYCTTYGNILDQTSTSNRKQEKRARNYAYEKLITLNKIIEAYNNRVKNRYELAEFLNVTEDFLQDALDHYKNKYGVCYVKGDYTIYFEPLGVLRMFK
jgi:Zn-dependent peptidase ImmA (M78 family)